MILGIDFDFGDGTANIFQDVPGVTYFHAEGRERREFVDWAMARESLREELDAINRYEATRKGATYTTSRGGKNGLHC